ncbi:MAG TPA: heavy metal-binding domain-containing protein [Acidothermaceae bacterium]
MNAESSVKAASSGAWAARLNGTELATVEAVGFRAIGVAMGMSIYRDVVYTGYPAGRGYGSPISRPASASQRFYPCPHGSNSLGHAPGLNYRQTWTQSPRRMALKHVLDKLVADGRSMGAHAVIGISVQQSKFMDGEPPIRQIRMTGTAVRAEGGENNAHGRLFTTTLSAGDLLALLLTGRTPLEITFGNAVVAVMPGCVLRHSKRAKGIVEITQLGDASEMAREAAVADLRADAAKASATDVVGIELDLDSALPPRAGAGWAAVHAYAMGTAVRRFENGLDQVGAQQIFRLVNRP